VILVLASSSPRRRELLSRLGLPFEVVPSELTERQPEPAEQPDAYALALARQKAEEVDARLGVSTVLAADTVVTVDGHILGKPADADDARRMLELLAGRSHVVVTAVAVRRGGWEVHGTESATVTMRPYGVRHIEAYVGTGEPMDRAGAYAVQGAGGALVASVQGCYETVVGLPLCLAIDLLTRAGEEGLPEPRSCCTHGGK
jgi:septum formation protein